MKQSKKLTRIFLATAMAALLGQALYAAQPSTIQPLSYVVKNLSIGQSPVKTIVPITGQTAAQVLQQAQVIADNADADMAEFRIDLLDFARDTPRVIALGQQVNQILKHKPLLLTIRTQQEGGKLQLSDAEYAEIYQQYLQQPFFQLLDIEMFRDEKQVKRLTQLAHQHKVLVVMSNHDFKQTPDQQEIIRRLLKQDQLGADILKIAVMPNSKQDVLSLMNATLAVSQQSRKPLLTMSMGGLGSISRVASANMGASLSFGMIGEASAPGQIDVSELKAILNTIQPER